MNSLEKALSRIEKNVDVTFAGPIPTGLLARQDLEAALVTLSDRLTPFRDRVTRTQGQGNATCGTRGHVLTQSHLDLLD